MNIGEAIAAVQQPRSRFQLEHFVIGQHDTPEMRFYQLCLELQDMAYKICLAQIGVRKSEVRIGRLEATGDELDALEAEEARLGLEQTAICSTSRRTTPATRSNTLSPTTGRHA